MITKARANEILGAIDTLPPGSCHMLYQEVLGALAGSSIPDERVRASVKEACEEIVASTKKSSKRATQEKLAQSAKPAAPKFTGKREQTVTRRLQVVLTPEELAERGNALVSTIRSQGPLVAQIDALKNQVKALNSELEVLSDEASKIAALIHAGAEVREVDVRVTLDMKEGTVTEVRLDTGEVITDRQMTKAESQGELPLSEPEAEDEVEEEDDAEDENDDA